MHPSAPCPPRMPWSLRLVVLFLLCLALCKLVVLLWTCVQADAMTQRVLLEAVLHGLFALIALLLAINLILRLPFGRACTMGFLCTLPLVKALRYAYDPLQWQLAGVHRFQEVVSAAIFVGLALLLVRKDVGAYLAPTPEEPPVDRPAP